MSTPLLSCCWIEYYAKLLQFLETIFPPATAATPYPEAGNITVSQAYYNLASHLPKNTKVIWGVNISLNNITAATLDASALHTAFTSSDMQDAGISLEFLEIRNEADLLGYHGRRNSSWDVQEYVQQ